MRCPKCHYLSFDPEPRCRNCGYELSLAEQEDDLAISGREATPDPLGDLVLNEDQAGGEVDGLSFFDPEVPSEDGEGTESTVAETSARGEDAAGKAKAAIELTAIDPEAAGPRDEEVAGDVPAASEDDNAGDAEPHDPTTTTPAAAPATSELPLFVRKTPADAGGPRAPESPRENEGVPPLATRRSTDEKKRVGSAAARKRGPLDRDLLEDLQRLEQQEDASVAADVEIDVEEDLPDAVGAASRLGAAAIDAAFVGGMSAAVLWITMRWCELPMAQVWMLPVIPTTTFLLLVCLGYLLMFTAAGGQTLGKMVMRIRVVGNVEGAGGTWRGLTVRQAFYREVLTIPSVLILGAGFLPALLGDHRALHDRIAHTRVVHT